MQPVPEDIFNFKELENINREIGDSDRKTMGWV
jgi:hypothetical protein